MKTSLITVVALTLAQLSVAQGTKVYSPGDYDNKYDMLLKNPGIQIEATEAINQLYNYKFYEADKEFRWLKVRYPNHPLPFFLIGLAEWWKIVPNTDVTDYDDKCLAYMDSTINAAEKLYDNTENKVEPSFFLAAAYAFKGRLHAERKHWAKATLAGKNSLKYFDKCKGNGDLSPELLFGDGLFNYYAQWIPQNYPALKPVLFFFPKGNKTEGIAQLEKNANNAFYTRTEARYFLMQIYSMENQYDKAYDLSKYMAEQYPDNPFFERYYARSAFVKGHLAEAETICTDILSKIEMGKVGYEAISGRTAAYILAYINQNFRQNDALAKQFYEKSIMYAKRSNSLDAGYYWSSVLALGKIATQDKEYDKATNYFKEVIDKSDRKASQYKEAKKLLDEGKKSRRNERRKNRD